MIICHPPPPLDFLLNLEWKAKLLILFCKCFPGWLCPSLWFPCPEVIQTLILWDQFSSTWTFLPPHLCVPVSFLSGQVSTQLAPPQRDLHRSSKMSTIFLIPSVILYHVTILILGLSSKHLVYLIIIYHLSSKWILHQILTPLGSSQYLEEALNHKRFFSKYFWINKSPFQVILRQIKVLFYSLNEFSSFLDFYILLNL